MITEGDPLHTHIHTDTLTCTHAFTRPVCVCVCVCLYVETHTYTSEKIKHRFFVFFFSEGSLEWMLWDSTVSMATTTHLLPLVGCLCMCARVCRIIYLHHYALKYLILLILHA